ncbi:hypothetical protein E8E14_003566 [Neopestalotiopsis sp. 37M]|nr:hypothetical protein E8E14_003566 [Neopestalotiopsis sp. 37M]
MAVPNVNRLALSWYSFLLIALFGCLSTILYIGFDLSQVSRPPRPAPDEPASTTDDAKPATNVDPSDHITLDEISTRRLAPPQTFRPTQVGSSNNQVTREFVFNVTRGFAMPAAHNKSMMLVNDQTPGPLIEASTGDTIRVLVNNLTPNESITIHWHGIDQWNTPWMDGVHGVSQCGIPPGASFIYEFQLHNQRGTFWYHSHFSLQSTDGLYGPLIIHDSQEKIPQVDIDQIVMVSDTYRDSAENLLRQYLSASPPWSPNFSGVEPPADNVLFNGHHAYNCSSSTASRAPDDQRAETKGTTNVNPGTCLGNSPYSLRLQKAGDAVRLRIINSGTFIPFWFTVDNHTLDIVEIDGVEVEPIATERVFVQPGQRYSAILVANQTAGNYFMRASAARWCFDMGDSFYGPESELSKAHFQAAQILSYADVPLDAHPIGSPWKLLDSRQEAPEPWYEQCLDLPYDMPKPLRQLDAYDLGEENHHYMNYQMREVDGAYRTFVNKFSGG